MKIQLINVAQKMPVWVDSACDGYLKRLPREWSLQQVTVPLATSKSKSSESHLQRRESAAIVDKLMPGSYSIALDEAGELWSSADWARQLQRWLIEFPRVNLVIGGPDGLSQTCLQRCQQRVALGRMTLPHALVKIIVLEQLYRAWTILQGHPYHRK